MNSNNSLMSESVEIIGAASILAYLFLPWPQPSGHKPKFSIIALYFIVAVLVICGVKYLFK